jgi:hypothetical protein
VLRGNALFEKLFRFQPGTAAGQTMFSLTAPSDLPKTMQVLCCDKPRCKGPEAHLDPAPSRPGIKVSVRESL